MNQTTIKQIIEDKKNGHTDEEIGKKHGVNFKFIEKAVVKHLGINVSSLNQKKKKVLKY